MHNHRIRGFATLHKACLALVAFAWFWCVLYFWVHVMGRELIRLPWNYAFLAVLAVVAASFGSFEGYGAFMLKRGWRRLGGAIVKANFQVALIAFFVFAAYFATQDKPSAVTEAGHLFPAQAETSRLFLLVYIGSCWPILAFVNHVVPGLLKRVASSFTQERQSVIIGDGGALDDMSNWISRHQAQGFSFAGAFATTRRTPEKLDLPLLGHYSLLDEYLAKHDVHQVVVVPDEHIDRWIPLVADHSNRHGCRVLIYNSLAAHFDSQLVFVEESGRQFFSLQNEPLESPFNRMVKRVFDLVLSIPAILFALPVLCFSVLVMQRLQSPGPLFFRQERVGQAGRRFVIWKFRSMAHDAKGERDEAEQATEDDKRIFAFGRFMRRFSVDEFPQFLNVFKGEMSLVGPRPYLAEHDYLFQRDYKAYRVRQFVKPGVTGPSQCRGLRGEFTDPELVRQRIEMDFDYVGSWSLWLDVEIVLRTVLQVIFPPRSAH